MAFKDWLINTGGQISDYGVRRGSYIAACEFSTGFLRRLGESGVNYGTPIYEKQWDAMLVLDGCRTDVLEELADEYSFLPETIPTYNSLGSHSYEWHLKNFTDEYRTEVSETGLISGNPFTRQFNTDEYELSEDDFAVFDKVWMDEWDNEIGTIPPRPITDRGISLMRDNPVEKLILHYMQPHIPFRNGDFHEGYHKETIGTESDKHPKDTWLQLRDGDVDPEAFWEAYKDNARWVLDEIELLLENMDAETVVITADHGNARGEFGVYGHPYFIPIPALKRVPWIVTSATDNGTYTPDMEYEPGNETELDQDDLEERLEDLGYM